MVFSRRVFQGGQLRGFQRRKIPSKVKLGGRRDLFINPGNLGLATEVREEGLLWDLGKG